MPHAALWVVQRRRFRRSCAGRSRFNAARGFVGGAAIKVEWTGVYPCCFNAARGFVGGAATMNICSIRIGSSFNAARGFVGGAAQRHDRHV